MALDTYANLQTSIANWLGRDDLTSYIPDFISLAETAIQNGINPTTPGLRVRELLRRATATLDEEYEQVPTDYLQMERLTITVAGNEYPLDFLSNVELTQTYGTTAPGTPTAYAVVGETIQFGPAPSSAIPMEMVYYRTIPKLSDSNTTNVVLTNYPNLYLFASLLMAEPFLKNDQRLATWADLYQSAIQGVTATEQRAIFNSGPLRVRLEGGATP